MPTFYTTLLTQIYGAELAEQIEPRLIGLVERYRGRIAKPYTASLSERDSLLITYGDQVQENGKAHLQTLTEFCESLFAGSCQWSAYPSLFPVVFRRWFLGKRLPSR